MDIFSLLTMIGGLSLFLYGMSTMGDGLVMLSGGKLERILEKLTEKRIMAVLLGTAVTAIIQSSSATTVMVVGFVNSGIMKLTQAVGVIMGANIGTTVTSWILSLTGIEGSSLFVRLLKPSSFSPVLSAIGIVCLMTGVEGSKKKNLGSIFLGFAILMFGMETMSGAVAPLKHNETFTGMFTAFSNPILGMAAGALLTAIIQSSSASVGILQALCSTGIVTFSTAIPIIMGQNIGTCITAMISSIGAKKNAKRAALIHLYFNLIGTIVFMAVFYTLHHFVMFGFMNASANAAGIAVVHTLFNIGSTILLFPFANQLVRLSMLTIPEREADPGNTDTELPASLMALDERFLDRPAFAMHLCKKAANEMAKISCRALKLSLGVLEDYSEEAVAEVIRLEQQTDQFEDVLGTYLVKLAGHDLSKKDSQQLSLILHAINYFERIADHAINLVESAQAFRDKHILRSDAAFAEQKAYDVAIRDIMEMATNVFVYENEKSARYVEPLEEVIDKLSIEMKQRHIQRLKEGSCSYESGMILGDIITNCERVSDQCSNIAVSLIEIRADEFDTHGYIDEMVKGSNPWFMQEYRRMKRLYALPQ